MYIRQYILIYKSKYILIMLKQSYVKIKIKKGSILYHTSDNKY